MKTVGDFPKERKIALLVSGVYQLNLSYFLFHSYKENWKEKELNNKKANQEKYKKKVGISCLTDS